MLFGWQCDAMCDYVQGLTDVLTQKENKNFNLIYIYIYK